MNIKKHYVFDPLLQCYWRGLLIDPPAKLTLLVGPDSCTDMDGAISLAREVLSGVKFIEVRKGPEGILDAIYFETADGWRSSVY